MTPQQAIADLREELRDSGEAIKIRRTTTTSTTTATVVARIMGFQPDELVGAIDQGSRKVVLLHEDLERQGWPSPPQKGDYLSVAGRVMQVMSCDMDTRRLQGVQIGYDLVAKG